MANKKLMLKTGTWTNRDGVVKNNWEQVGDYIENDKGSYIQLKSYINFSQFANADGKVTLSMFDYDQKGSNSSYKAPDLQGDIPF